MRWHEMWDSQLGERGWRPGCGTKQIQNSQPMHVLAVVLENYPTVVIDMVRKFLIGELSTWWMIIDEDEQYTSNRARIQNENFHWIHRDFPIRVVGEELLCTSAFDLHWMHRLRTWISGFPSRTHPPRGTTPKLIVLVFKFTRCWDIFGKWNSTRIGDNTKITNSKWNMLYVSSGLFRTK